MGDSIAGAEMRPFCSWHEGRLNDEDSRWFCTPECRREYWKWARRQIKYFGYCQRDECREPARYQIGSAVEFRLCQLHGQGIRRELKPRYDEG